MCHATPVVETNASAITISNNLGSYKVLRHRIKQPTNNPQPATQMRSRPFLRPSPRRFLLPSLVRRIRRGLIMELHRPSIPKIDAAANPGTRALPHRSTEANVD